MSAPLRAAAVIPLRDDGFVLCGTRSQSARSYPGYFAFPGGGVDDDDDTLPLFTQASAETNNTDVERAERAGALRELGEESGLFSLCQRDGAAPSAEQKTRFCKTLDEACRLRQALDISELVLDDRALVRLGLWQTPGFFSRPFRVRQFLLELKNAHLVQTAPCDELENIGFRDPQDVLDEWRRGGSLLLEPIRFALEGIAGDRSSLVERLETPAPGKACKSITLRQNVAGIFVQPMRTPTLPPATHTNTIFIGRQDFFIVDPATPYEDERSRTDALIEERQAAGDSPIAILLTHHHPDHVGDVVRLREKFGLPVWAHRHNRTLVDFEIDRFISDNEIFVASDERIKALFTPGHAKGHLCFLHENSKTLVAGDMVASVGSILIDPDEGHMQTYLASLDRLLSEDFKNVVPSHGPMLAEGKSRIALQRDHREMRLQQTLDTLRALGKSTPLKMAAKIYAGQISEAMLPLAGRSVLSSLIALVEREQVLVEDDHYCVR